MSTLIQEVRFALRSLRRQPGVTVAIIFTLAIGLGVNAAMFNAIDKLLLSPFSFRDVDRMLVMSELTESEPYPKEAVSPANFADIAKETTVFDRIVAFGWAEVNLSGGERPERVAGKTVSAQFFEALGVTPAQGRFFSPTDMIHGRHHVVVLSDALWRGRFGADADVIGRTVQIDGEVSQVVGVAPKDFTFPDGAEIWMPFAPDAKEAANRTSRYLTVFGHLAPGRSAADARAELSGLYARLQQQYPEAFRGGRRLSVLSFTRALVDFGMPTVLVLWQAAAMFVLLIGCANVINLLLAQGAERQRELAVRMALGAGRARLMRQLLMESLTTAVIAVPAALAVAWVALRLMKAAMPPALVRFVPGWDQMEVSLPLLGWTTLAALVIGALLGLLPALQASRRSVLGSIKNGGDGGRSETAGRGRHRARRMLVVAEVALALPLLVASALAVIGVQRFVTGEQGYDPHGLLRASIVLPDRSYEEDARVRQFSDRLLTALRSLPGVTSAAASSVLPASSSNRSGEFQIDGRPADRERPLTVNYRNVTTQYFETMRIPVREGRDFTAQDREASLPVAVVSQSMAARYWPGQSPIGARVKLPRVGEEWITVVGVVGDVIDDWFANRNAPTFYVPVAQSPSHSVNLVVRTTGDLTGVETGVRRAVAAIDAQLPVHQLRTMSDAMQERTTGLRFIGGLMAVFGAIAVVLAAVGIYSVMSFYVTQRRKEIGVRLALGATPSAVLRMTMRHASWLAGLGVTIGLALAVALARLMEQAMFGTVSPDPRILGSVALMLFGVAALSSFLPARDATRVDPATTLRD
jgi:putative ABC transport system permease protein